MADEWQKAETVKKEYWKPTAKGDEKIGVMVRGEVGDYKGKPTMQYVIMTVDGECYTPNHTVLNNQLVTVKTGQKVKIVYQGTAEKTKKGKAAAELYDVFISNAPIQTTIPAPEPKPEIIDSAGKVLETLKKAPSGMMDTPFWDMVVGIVGSMPGGVDTVTKLKAEGKITQDPTTRAWRAT